MKDFKQFNDTYVPATHGFTAKIDLYPHWMGMVT